MAQIHFRQPVAESRRHQTALISRATTGEFKQEIRGLEAGQRYQFQAIVKHSLLTLMAKDGTLAQK